MMKIDPEFRCPLCLGKLELKDGSPFCGGCGKSYGFREEVIDFSDREVSEETRKTVSQFGESWKIFDHVEPYHLGQFLDWISPADESAFRGARVLEAGCGKGRHSFIISGFKPSRLFAVDLSEAVFIARRNAPSADCVFARCDIKRLPFAGGGFDVVVSVGVLHHIDEPEKGLLEMWRVLKPGGILVLWVYAREGNGWIVRLVDPVRKALTSKIPTATLRRLSFPLSGFLYLLLKLLYGPATGWGKREAGLLLPYSSYLGSISPFPFVEIDNIVVDHLCPPVARYLSRGEIEAMFASLKPSKLELRWHHRNSWTVSATKPLEKQP